jgi:hypothetical protein
MENEILYVFSSYDLFSEDRKEKNPSGLTALVGLGVLVEVLDHTRKHSPRYDSPGRVIGPSQRSRGINVLNCRGTAGARVHARTRTVCFIMLIVKWIDT